MVLKVFVLSAFLGMIAHGAQCQVVVSHTLDSAFFRVCNFDPGEMRVFDLSTGQKKLTGTLATDECFFVEFPSYSMVSPKPVFLAESASSFQLFEAPVPESGSVVDWEKIVLVFLGVLAASLKSIFDLFVNPLVAAVRMHFRVSAATRVAIDSLRQASGSVELDRGLIDVWQGKTEVVWVPKRILAKIELLRDVLSDVEQGNLGRVDAIKKLGGDV